MISLNPDQDLGADTERSGGSYTDTDVYRGFLRSNFELHTYSESAHH